MKNNKQPSQFPPFPSNKHLASPITPALSWNPDEGNMTILPRRRDKLNAPRPLTRSSRMKYVCMIMPGSISAKKASPPPPPPSSLHHHPTPNPQTCTALPLRPLASSTPNPNTKRYKSLIQTHCSFLPSHLTLFAASPAPSLREGYVCTVPMLLSLTTSFW